MSDEKRIYVIVAETVQPDVGFSVAQPAGRIAAQVGHVVSKTRLRIAFRTSNLMFEPITTIVLAVKNTVELEHMHHVLRLASIDHDFFEDTNEEVYGYDPILNGPVQVTTALATIPIERKRLEGLIDHLPLYTPECEKGKA